MAAPSKATPAAPAPTSGGRLWNISATAWPKAIPVPTAVTFSAVRTCRSVFSWALCPFMPDLPLASPSISALSAGSAVSLESAPTLGASRCSPCLVASGVPDGAGSSPVSGERSGAGCCSGWPVASLVSRSSIFRCIASMRCSRTAKRCLSASWSGLVSVSVSPGWSGLASDANGCSSGWSACSGLGASAEDASVVSSCAVLALRAVGSAVSVSFPGVEAFPASSLPRPGWRACPCPGYPQPDSAPNRRED
jgi:hypothetical protein